jgi:hypothetical protein
MFRESVSLIILLKSIPDSAGVNSRKRTGFSLQAIRIVSDKHSQIVILPMREYSKEEILNRYLSSMNFLLEYFKDCVLRKLSGCPDFELLYTMPCYSSVINLDIDLESPLIKIPLLASGYRSKIPFNISNKSSPIPASYLPPRGSKE